MEHTAFPRLFAPLKIGALKLPNRIVMPALHLVYCPEGYINDRLISFYTRRAKGGAGLLIVGGCSVDDRGYSANMIGMHDARYSEGLSRLTAAVHKEGAFIAAQLFQSGRYAKASVTGRPGIAPSSVYSRYSKALPEEMTNEQIMQTVQAFATAAGLAKESGFDAVEIVGSAGFLISQFLSPLTNLRTDEFGGTEENRFRFAGMVLHSVRAVVGPDFPVIMRIAGNDFVKGGNASPQAVSFAGYLNRIGVDALNVTGGWHEAHVPQLTGHLPPGGFSYLAAAVKDAVDVPVFSSNRFNDPLVAERVLALGMADAVCLGRQLVCDPDTPAKARSGRTLEIIKCVACGQGCTDHIFAGKAFGCVLNAFAGDEYRLKLEKTDTPLEIAVAGGGPAGMTAAIVAAQRGHRVTLYEQSQALGGSLNTLTKFPAKKDYGALMETLSYMLKENQVRVLRGKPFDVAMAEHADAVVVATGGSYIPVEPGGFTGNLCTTLDVLVQRVVPGRQVVVLGSNGLEWETALWLGDDASVSPALSAFLLAHEAETPETVIKLSNSCRRQITVVTGALQPAAQIGIGTRWIINKELGRRAIQCVCGVAKMHLTPEGVEAVLADGERRIVPADTVVLTAKRPEYGLYTALKQRGIPAYLIGDAVKPGAMGYVVKAATRLAMRL